MVYKFELIDSLGNSIQIDEPIGWDTANLKVKRDLKYHGLTYQYTNDLQFINNGYALLSDIYNTEGIEAELYLRISIQATEDTDFVQVFEGRANFANYTEFIGDYCYCTVNFEEQNESLLLFNNMEKQIDLFADNDVTHIVDLHSKAIELTGVFDKSSLVSPQIPNYNTLSTIEIVAMELPMIVNSNDLFTENNNGVLDAFSTNAVVDTTFPDIITQINPRLITPYTASYNFKGNFTGQFRINSGISYNIADASILYSINNNPATEIVNISNGSGVISGNNIFNFNSDFDFDLSLNENDNVKVYFSARINYLVAPPIAFQVYLTFTNCNFTIKTLSIADPSTARTVLVHEAFDKVSQFILNKSNAFFSNFLGRKDIGYALNGCGSFMAITNGFAIRQFENKPLFVSFKSLFEALQPVYNLGVGIVEGKVRIEPMQWFYDQNLIVGTFSFIREIKIKTKQELIYNRAKFGYLKNGSEEGTDKSNTLDAFATIREYNTPIKQIKNEFQAVSTAIADHYALEFTRRKQFLKTSTSDWKFDNDLFLICLNRTTFNGIAISLNIAEKDENFTEINNILSPETSYNLRISPMRNVLSFNQQLGGAWNKQTGNSLTFASGEKNFLMSSNLNSSCNNSYEKNLLTENQNLAFDDTKNSINSIIFEPQNIECVVPLSWTAYQLIKDKLNAKIELNSRFSGYIENIEYNPNEGTATLLLLKAYESGVECNVDYVEVDYVECDYVE